MRTNYNLLTGVPCSHRRLRRGEHASAGEPCACSPAEDGVRAWHTRQSVLTGYAVICAAIVLMADARAIAAEPLAAPAADDVRSQALQWVAARGITAEAVLKEAAALWSDLPSDASARVLLERTVETFAAADSDVRAFVEACRVGQAWLVPPEATVLAEAEPASFFAANLRLYYARSLAQRQMYDEALAQFEQIDPRTVVDPATCLFYRAVCEHALLQKGSGLETIARLLQDTENVPVSYASVAVLMRHDLEALEDKSLDAISRKMRDSERRLELARGGQRVQKVQGEIIADLDELIEKLEAQMSGGGGGGSGNSRNQSAAPAGESTVKGEKARGDAERKTYRNEGGWGNLPEKEQAKAKNLIGREFPSHYRQAVEEYFKKLAERQGGGK